MPRMKNWIFVDILGRLQKPEVNNEVSELEKTCLFGQVYDDIRSNLLTTEFADGHRVITSPICEIDWANQCIKTRSGTLYRLDGRPHEDYIRWLSDNKMLDQYCDVLFPMAN